MYSTKFNIYSHGITLFWPWLSQRQWFNFSGSYSGNSCIFAALPFVILISQQSCPVSSFATSESEEIAEFGDSFVNSKSGSGSSQLLLHNKKLDDMRWRSTPRHLISRYSVVSSHSLYVAKQFLTCHNNAWMTTPVRVIPTCRNS